MSCGYIFSRSFIAFQKSNLVCRNLFKFTVRCFFLSCEASCFNNITYFGSVVLLLLLVYIFYIQINF